jgi:hypothetical protein
VFKFLFVIRPSSIILHDLLEINSFISRILFICFCGNQPRIHFSYIGKWQMEYILSLFLWKWFKNTVEPRYIAGVGGQLRYLRHK